jgi:hypothetical protein
VATKTKLGNARAIAFGWTSAQLLAGVKTCTRRIWNDTYAAYFIKVFEQGRPVPCLDKSFRNGGKIIGYARLVCPPYKEKLQDMPISDLEAEGGMCSTIEEFISKYFEADKTRSVWVIRFEFFPLDVKAAS